jgi:hypothetical protein
MDEDTLRAHLEERYGVRVTEARALTETIAARIRAAQTG